MPLQESDINVQSIVIEPSILVDTLTSTDNYIGTSRSFRDPSKPNWRIKRVYQIGTVWKIGYPNGDQGFNFVWDLRFTYVYS
jgi:hypothetical protein